MDRPTSVVVLGVINICFGFLSLCANVFGVGFLFIMKLELIDLPGTEEQLPAGFELVYSLVLVVVKIVLATILVVSGVGVFMARDWARRGCVIYGVVGGLMVLIETPLGLLNTAETRATLESTMPAAQVGPIMAFSIATVVVLGLISIAYCAANYYFMTRPKVKAWFAAAGWDGTAPHNGAMK